MKTTVVNTLKFLFFLAIGGGILYVVYQNQNDAYRAQCALDGVPEESCSLLLKVLEDFAQADWLWILVVLIAFVVSNFSRALRWNMLLRPLGYTPTFRNAFWTIMLGYFANLGLPRMGEVVRAGAMARYERIPVEKVMGTVVVDRIADAISLLLLIGLAFLIEFDRLWGVLSANMAPGQSIGDNWWLLVLAIGLLGSVATLSFIYRKRLLKFPLVRKVLDLLKGFAEGLKTVRSLDKPWLFVFHSAIIWFMYFLMTYLCFFAFAPTAHLTASAGLLVFIFGAFGIIIPSPGGMGTYHFLVMEALAIYDISRIEAFSFANICFFSIQIFCNILLGLVALIALPQLNRKYHPSGPEVTPTQEPAKP